MKVQTIPASVVPAALCFLAVRAFYAAGTRCKAMVVSCLIPWIHDKRLGAYWQSSMEHVDKAWMHNWAAVAYSAYRLYVTVARIWVSSINAKLLCIQRQPIQQTLRWMTGCQPKAAKDASIHTSATSHILVVHFQYKCISVASVHAVQA